jgi:hypothetical protein
MTVLLAICALLPRIFVLRMIRLARIAESALACHMSGCLALAVRVLNLDAFKIQYLSYLCMEVPPFTEISQQNSRCLGNLRKSP